jgi:hypothetical protein
MKDWSGKTLCFECAKKVGANINIGHKLKGRCHRCHSEQTLFMAREVPITSLTDEGICPECAHPFGTHAAACQRSELELLKAERQEIVGALQELGAWDPEKSLADQIRHTLRDRKDQSGGRP